MCVCACVCLYVESRNVQVDKFTVNIRQNTIGKHVITITKKINKRNKNKLSDRNYER